MYFSSIDILKYFIAELLGNHIHFIWYSQYYIEHLALIYLENLGPPFLLFSNICESTNIKGYAVASTRDVGRYCLNYTMNFSFMFPNLIFIEMH